eukprot:Hpha_TRINITY_DN31064_c0_g1::TRINITY_DN31064_c0_g1_i1::g.64059::m.64059
MEAESRLALDLEKWKDMEAKIDPRILWSPRRSTMRIPEWHPGMDEDAAWNKKVAGLLTDETEGRSEVVVKEEEDRGLYLRAAAEQVDMLALEAGCRGSTANKELEARGVVGGEERSARLLALRAAWEVERRLWRRQEAGDAPPARAAHAAEGERGRAGAESPPSYRQMGQRLAEEVLQDVSELVVVGAFRTAGRLVWAAAAVAADVALRRALEPRPVPPPCSDPLRAAQNELDEVERRTCCTEELGARRRLTQDWRMGVEEVRESWLAEPPPPPPKLSAAAEHWRLLDEKETRDEEAAEERRALESVLPTLRRASASGKADGLEDPGGAAAFLGLWADEIAWLPAGSVSPSPAQFQKVVGPAVRVPPALSGGRPRSAVGPRPPVELPPWQRVSGGGVVQRGGHEWRRRPMSASSAR